MCIFFKTISVLHLDGFARLGVFDVFHPSFTIISGLHLPQSNIFGFIASAVKGITALIVKQLTKTFEFSIPFRVL